jgi:internalin A
MNRWATVSRRWRGLDQATCISRRSFLASSLLSRKHAEVIDILAALHTPRDFTTAANITTRKIPAIKEDLAEAERLIAECRARRDAVLELRRLALGRLPQSIRDLTWLTELVIDENNLLDADFAPEKSLGFDYRYDAVLPEGLLPRFIVETYVHREPKHAWRSGVVLERANCRALVRGDVQGRSVTIRVAGVGQGRRELLGIIREYFERIHKSFEKLPVTELVPIPKHPEVVVPYNELLAYEASGDDEYKVVVDGQVVKLSVAALLDGVDLPGVRRPADKDVPFHRDFVAERDSLSLFISYSHKDERFRDELRGALTAYERLGEINSWDDTDIVPGQTWEPEIPGKLERADIVVLLLSNDFIRSDYCYVKEMERARQRDAAGECAIVPIVVRASPYEKLELGRIQAIVPKGKPIEQHKPRAPAWLEVTKQLDRAIANLKKKRLTGQ